MFQYKNCNNYTFIVNVVQFTSCTLALLKTKRTVGIYNDNKML